MKKMVVLAALVAAMWAGTAFAATASLSITGEAPMAVKGPNKPNTNLTASSTWTSVIFQSDPYRANGQDGGRILVAACANTTEGYAFSATPAVDRKSGEAEIAYKTGRPYDECLAYVAMESDWQTPISETLHFSLPLE